jgi:DNA-binding XRE family transcriptional regulator
MKDNNTKVMKFIRLRARFGMSQAEFASTIGISQTLVSGYECGKYKPGFKILRKMLDLAKARGVKYNEDEFIC